MLRSRWCSGRSVPDYCSVATAVSLADAPSFFLVWFLLAAAKEAISCCWITDNASFTTDCSRHPNQKNLESGWGFVVSDPNNLRRKFMITNKQGNNVFQQ
uniref:Uncharacterized protein n=1 Tax=Anopheles minimus TaxID=112268 RepID=A0A182WP13_9DIPT